MSEIDRRNFFKLVMAASAIAVAGGGTVAALLPELQADEDGQWLIPAGQLLSRTSYKELFEVLGEHYGAGDGKMTFALPDLRNCMELENPNPISTSGYAICGRSCHYAMKVKPGGEEFFPVGYILQYIGKLPGWPDLKASIAAPV